MLAQLALALAGLPAAGTPFVLQDMLVRVSSKEPRTPTLASQVRAQGEAQ
jgi:hypothetical protein